MKHFLAIAALFVSSLAMGQWSTLPYNPDENGDMLIGVADLQALLANYGNEFSSAVVSEDGESAIVYMGDAAYPLCELNCRELPGIWNMPSIADLGLVWNEVYTTSTSEATWLAPSRGRIQENSGHLEFFNSPNTSEVNSHVMDVTNNPGREYRCYCAAKQLPRVEYSYCNGTASSVEACATSKVEDGWYPLQGIDTYLHCPTCNSGFQYQVVTQAFWRFAQ